jgi:hypothetical protein
MSTIVLIGINNDTSFSFSVNTKQAGNAMPFDLPHVASRVYGMPLLIARPKLDVILSVLTPRMMGEPIAASGESHARSSPRITDAGIAILPVMGTLVRRASGMSALSGLCSYHEIQDMAEDAFTNPEVKAVLLGACRTLP